MGLSHLGVVGCGVGGKWAGGTERRPRARQRRVRIMRPGGSRTGDRRGRARHAWRGQARGWAQPLWAQPPWAGLPSIEQRGRCKVVPALPWLGRLRVAKCGDHFLQARLHGCHVCLTLLLSAMHLHLLLVPRVRCRLQLAAQSLQLALRAIQLRTDATFAAQTRQHVRTHTTVAHGMVRARKHSHA